ncbi:MAG TPA: phage major capsid protein [bacterium]|nr:phage major capsid protein [bacterium]
MSLTAEQIVDLLTTTQKDLGRLEWVNLTTDLQEYVALPKILKKESVKFSGGIGIQWNVKVAYTNSAHNVGLFEEDSLKIGDGMKTASIPWRHCSAHYAFERREVLMNRGPYQIVDLYRSRRQDGQLSLAELMEQNFWGKPDDSTDEMTPYGVAYWVVKNSTEGFNGGNPSGFSDGCGGLSSVTYPRWRNWTAQYAEITREDLVRKWRKAATFTKFISPVEGPKDYNRGDRYGYYTNYNVIGPLEELLDDRNDNLGPDLATNDGKVLFRRLPVVWVPYLESDSTDPIYGINWGVFQPVFLDGDYLHEEKPQAVSNSHNVFAVYIDCTFNFRCTDRRRLFVLYK